MGNLCPCLCPVYTPVQSEADNVATSRTPLLSGKTTSSNGQPVSARQFTPPRQDIASDLQSVKYSKLTMRPTKVLEVDKLLQDQAKLFNDILDKRCSLDDAIHEFMSELHTDNLHSAFQALKESVKDQSKITLKRRQKFCMEMLFKQDDLEPDTIRSIVSFNKANKLIKDILDRLPVIVTGVELVVRDEDKLRRKLLQASQGRDGPDLLKNCNDDIGLLRNIPEMADNIEKETKRKFQSLVDSATVFFSD